MDDNTRQYLDGRFDRVEAKLDGHLERITKTEADLSWLQGAAKWALSLAIATLGTLAGAVAKFLDITLKH